MIHLLIFSTIFFGTEGAKILGIFMTPSYSHQIVFQPIWKELSLKGHEVTVYTPSPLNDPSLINLTEYDLSFSYDHLKELEKVYTDYNEFFQIYEEISERQFKHHYIQDLIQRANNQSYDLLLVEYLWQPYYAFKEIYNVPMIGISSVQLTIAGSDALGMEKHPVVDPDLFFHFAQAKTFIERVKSWMHNWLYRMVVKSKLNPVFNRQIRKYFDKVSKTAAELAKEVNLVIGNYNFVLQTVKPINPTFIPVSAIHVRPQQPLPEDLEKILSNLKTDAIYFCLGTNVKSSKLAQNQLNKILRVLEKLPYTILWKYESDIIPENLPKNFIIRKWFPQQDILGHPKVKLFITQGGIQSIDEALNRKVPMLVIPFIADQKGNANRITALGIAETIDFNSFTEKELDEKVQNILLDPSYQKNIEKQSKIASDQPISSLDKAIFWIEYVLRHDGATHLRYAAVDLPFYQYYLLDVYAFVTFTSILIFVIFRKLILGCVVTFHDLFLAKEPKKKDE